MDRFFALSKVKFDEYGHPVFTKKTSAGSSMKTLSGVKGFYDGDIEFSRRDIFEYHGYFEEGVWHPTEGAEEAMPATPPAGPVTLFDAFNPSTEVAERSGRLWLKGEGGEALIGCLLGHRVCKSAKDVADAIYKAMGLTPLSAEPAEEAAAGYCRETPVNTVITRDGVMPGYTFLGIQGTGTRISLGRHEETRAIAHAILEAIGEPVPAESEFPKPLGEAYWKFVVDDNGRWENEVRIKLKGPMYPTLDLALPKAEEYADRNGKDVIVYQAVARVSPKPATPPTPERTIVRADKKAA